MIIKKPSVKFLYPLLWISDGAESHPVLEAQPSLQSLCNIRNLNTGRTFRCLSSTTRSRLYRDENPAPPAAASKDTRRGPKKTWRWKLPLVRGLHERVFGTFYFIRNFRSNAHLYICAYPGGRYVMVRVLTAVARSRLRSASDRRGG